MRRIVFACSCIIVFAVVALGAAKPKEKKKPEISPHAQAIQLVMATQQKKIREVDRNNWWHDVKEREWKAKRPFYPGHIDTTHMFVVSYHIDGKAVHSWWVDTRKKTVQSRKIEPAPAVKADTVPEPTLVPKKGVTVTIRQSDEDAKPESTIDENTARKLAIEQYNKLFCDKYILNPLDAKHHKFPELDAKYFYKAEIKDGCWQLAGAPPAGWFVLARVSLDGKWVQLTSVGFALE